LSLLTTPGCEIFVTRTFTIHTATEEFVSTFQEWHYFAGGAALGFLLGAEWALRRVSDE